MTHSPEIAVPVERALVFDREPLVRERAAQLLSLEGFQTCTVDSAALFTDLCRTLEFKLYLAGFRSSADGQDFARLFTGPGELPEPLVLLVPPEPMLDAAYFSVAFPGARQVDRRLSDPSALQGRSGPERPAVVARAGAPLADTVRGMFGPFGLSERQLEVLGRALLGEGTTAIAAHLFISELTVRNHLHAIYSQVGVSGHRELTGRFVRGLIEAGDTNPL